MKTINNSNKTTIACIDIGSNSVHLVVARVDKRGQLEIIDSDKATIRLASYLSDQRVLSDDGINSCCKAVKHMVEIAKHHTDNIYSVATYTVRMSKNANDLLKKIRKECGIIVEIVKGSEEARLEFLGAQKALKLGDEDSIVVDIGGGSSEVSIFDASKKEVVFAQSFNIGAVTLTQKFLSKRYSKDRFKKMEQYIRDQLSGKLPDIKSKKFSAVICSGTGKALTKISRRNLFGESVSNQSNGAKFSSKQLKAIYAEFKVHESAAKIADSYPIDAKRSEIIAAGACILNEISKEMSVQEWAFSIYSLREGLVVDSHRRYFSSDKENYARSRLQSIRGLAARFSIEPKKGRKIADICSKIYECLIAEEMVLKNQPFSNEPTLLEAACFLCEVGRTINHSKYHLHSDYIIRNCDITGFTHHELNIIAQIIRFHRKSVASEKKLNSYPLISPNIQRLKALSLCLRLSVALNRTWKDGIDEIEVSCSSRFLQFTMPKSYETILEVEISKLAEEEWACEDLLGRQIAVEFLQ